MSAAQTPARSSKRARGLDPTPDAKTANKSKSVRTVSEVDQPTIEPDTSRKYKKAKVDDETHAPTKTPAKTPKANRLSSAASSSSTNLPSISPILSSDPSTIDSIELAAQVKTIQAVIIQAAQTESTSANNLLSNQLWNGFLRRLRHLQPNTVRLELHILTAIGKAVGMIIGFEDNAAADDTTPELLSTLTSIFSLLLPSYSTPLAESWTGSFRPTYDFFVGLVGTVVKGFVLAGATTKSLNRPELWNLLSSLFSSFTLINESQTSQRKVYDTVIQERCLPVWAELMETIRQRLDGAKGKENKQLTLSLEATSAAIAQTIQQALFHTEHLSLYADALGSTGVEEKELEEHEATLAAQEAKSDRAKERGDEDEEMKDSQHDDDGTQKSSVETGGEPANKKQKVSKEIVVKKEAKPAIHKPHPANYTRKLFDGLAGWINKDSKGVNSQDDVEMKGSESEAKSNGRSKTDKKRKHDPSSTETPLPSTVSTASTTPHPFTSRSVRYFLPQIFSAYLNASETQWKLLYPVPSTDGRERDPPALTGVELRRKQNKERLRNQRELQFLQAMWKLNEKEGLGALAANVESIFRTQLTPISLPLLHDLFHTNIGLFHLVQEKDLYRIHQDSNTTAHSSGSDGWTGVKGLLGKQMQKLMTVAREMVRVAGARKGTSVSSTKKKSASLTHTSDLPSLISLLSLSTTLAKNILALLQLNPEFVGRYLESVHGEDDDDDANSSKSKSRKEHPLNVWHVIWTVIDMSNQNDGSIESDPSDSSSLTSITPPSTAITSAQILSQELFQSFFKLRQYDVLFRGYLSAAYDAEYFPGLTVVEFDRVNSSGFDLAGLMRSIPPLKVPSLWSWFLKETEKEFSSSSSSKSSNSDSAAASRTLVHFFVYFLDTMLIREETAIQLQELYVKTFHAIIEQPLQALRRDASEFNKFKMLASPEVKAMAGPGEKKGTKKSKGKKDDHDAMDTSEENGTSNSTTTESTLEPCSLFLLLHSLNDVKSQCDQHTTKTYETMMQPLKGYFGDFVGEGDSTDSSASLTQVIHHLASTSSNDPILLHALHQVALQRLQQLARFQSKSIVVNHFATDDDVNMKADYSSDENDSDAESDKVNKKGSITKVPSVNSSATHEAQSLTSFLLSEVASCCCYTSVSKSDHSQFVWDGSSASLGSGSSHAVSSVALWSQITSSMDTLEMFATREQLEELVRKMVKITSCRFCAADARANKKSFIAAGSTSHSHHTLYSLTSSLLLQTWFYELSTVRTVLLDVVLEQSVKLSEKLVQGITVPTELKESTSTLRVPTQFTLTLPHSKHFATLRAVAEGVASGSISVGLSSSSAKEKKSKSTIASSSATIAVDPSDLWDLIWLLQLLHSLPQSYLLTAPGGFHALLVQVLWSVEAAASVRCTSSPKDDEPLSLMNLATRITLTQSHVPSLYSHVSLAARRMFSSSLLGLAQHSPSGLTAAFVTQPTLSQWFCLGSLESRALIGRHITYARNSALQAINGIAPILLASKHQSEERSDSSMKGKKNGTSVSGPFAPVVQHINSALGAPAKRSTTALVWSLQLASAITSSFLSAWSEGSSTAAEIARRATGLKDASVVQALKGWCDHDAALGSLFPLMLSYAVDSKDTQVLPVVLELQAHTLLAFHVIGLHAQGGADKAEAPAPNVAPVVHNAFTHATTILSTDASSHVARDGALTFIHAVSVVQPAGDHLSVPVLFRTLVAALCGSSLTSHHRESIQHSFLTIIASASQEQCDSIVNQLLEGLDSPIDDSGLSRTSACLTLLQSFLSHAYTSVQRRAISSSRLSLLLFRLANGCASWSNMVVGRTSISPIAFTLVQSSLPLLSTLLSRPQIFSLDDQSLSLISHTLIQAASVLKPEFASAGKEEVSTTSTVVNISSLSHHLYLSLYSLVKYHSSLLVRVIPIYLTLLRHLLTFHYRMIQSSSPSSPLPLVSSENIGRLLEEIGRPANAKLFNKYLVGVLIDWTQITRYKGATNGNTHQELHLKAIQKGFFAIIHLIEEHDLAYLHHLLDSVGRVVFRSLHSAYKKTRFTGLV